MIGNTMNILQKFSVKMITKRTSRSLSKQGQKPVYFNTHKNIKDRWGSYITSGGVSDKAFLALCMGNQTSYFPLESVAKKTPFKNNAKTRINFVQHKQ
tara:strand:+ start:1895 stop:2188 length:294 start_codon:yes stop_codon:yes gene_type:complete